MMKLPPKIYRGIEYVVLSDLPHDQQQLARDTPDLEFIKILFSDGRLEEHCIQFHVYSTWYERVFAVKTGSANVVPENPDVRIAFNG